MNSLYRHFKGNLYFVIGEARDVTYGGYEEVIVYQALDGEENELFTRGKNEFFEGVTGRMDNVTGQELRFEPYSGNK